MEAELLLALGGLLLAGAAAALVAARAGLPIQVAILGLGLLLGSDGPGGIEFSDAELARTVGIVGLVAILFEGGLVNPWRSIRPVLPQAALLSTLGVAVTAAVTGLVAWLVVDLTFPEALLLGAVVGSTDAAAVFAILRFTPLRPRTAALLEAESGLNDPMAVALVGGLVALVGGTGTWGGLALDVVRELGVGLAVGLALGWLAALGMRRFPARAVAFAPVVSVAIACVAYGAAGVLHGSGFLSVYLVAMRLGSTPSVVGRSVLAFHQGLAFVAQVVLFGVLGLLAFPSQLPPLVLPGLAVAAALVLVARPLAVLTSLPGRSFPRRERGLVAWAGLRGAVPIVLATFPLSAHLAASGTIFNVVFFVVAVSAIVQGPTLVPIARRLDLLDRRRRPAARPIEVGMVGGAEIFEFAVGEDDHARGLRVRELGVPRTALVAVILRDGRAVPPRGSTRVEAGDVLYLLTSARDDESLRARFGEWRHGPRRAGGADGDLVGADPDV